MSTKKADYRVVADTGSTDDTVMQLIKHGVTVHSITVKPWRFDVARNCALVSSCLHDLIGKALVPADADVCLTLDMDEVIADDFVDKLRMVWIPEKHTLGMVPFNTGSVWLAQRVRIRYARVL